MNQMLNSPVSKHPIVANNKTRSLLKRFTTGENEQLGEDGLHRLQFTDYEQFGGVKEF